MTAEDIQDARDRLKRGVHPQTVAELAGLKGEKELFELLKTEGEETNMATPNKIARNEGKAFELYNSEANDKKIAKALGVSKGSVLNWRKRNGLPAHRKQKLTQDHLIVEKPETVSKVSKPDQKPEKRIEDAKTVPVIKDSGDRTRFETGAVRDMHEGKGRYDLLPWVALGRLAGHFEKGAIKYGESNWRNGIPIHSYMDSAVRHLAKYMMGMTDEDHLVAAAWNVMCALETEMTMPGMQDLPARKGKNDG